MKKAKGHPAVGLAVKTRHKKATGPQKDASARLSPARKAGPPPKTLSTQTSGKVASKSVQPASKTSKKSAAVVVAERPLTDAERALLQAGGADLERHRHTDDAVEKAAALYKRLCQESYTVEEAAKLLGVNDSRIRQRLSVRTVYGIKRDGEWRIPKFQFDGNALVPGIGTVVANLPDDLDPVSIYTWFVTKNTDLYGDRAETFQLSPIDWLRTGHSADTLAEIARDL